MKNFYYILKPVRVYQNDGQEKQIDDILKEFKAKAKGLSVLERATDDLKLQIEKEIEAYSYINFRIAAITATLVDAFRAEEAHRNKTWDEIQIYDLHGNKYYFTKNPKNEEQAYYCVLETGGTLSEKTPELLETSVKIHEMRVERKKNSLTKEE